MPAATEEVRYSFPILKWDTTEDGDIVVYGKCTDGTVDADHQIVDPAWSGKALDTWLVTGGNMRVQHSPFLYPAGKGLALEIDRDGDGAHWLKALVVEDNAKKLVSKGVLRDFSIGILDPQLSYRSPMAPEGTIVGGRVGEVSLVDRGSNKNSGFTIAKSVGDNPQLVQRWFGKYAASPAQVGKVLNKKKKRIVDSGGTDRTDTPSSQFAGPHNTFPVENTSDVSDAASLAHHAANPGAVRSKIRNIAEGKLDMDHEDLPPSLKDGVACKTCKGTGKIRDGNMDCPDCKGKGIVPQVTKGDAAQDYPGASTDTDDSLADYDADMNGSATDAGARPPKAKKNKTYSDLLAKGQRPKRGKKDPSAVAGGAKGKQSDPAPIPAGQVDADVEGSDFTGKASGTGSQAPWSMVALHNATCPERRSRATFKSMGYNRIADALPLREFQTMAIDALSKGATDLADYYIGLVKLGESIIDLPDSVLNRARKFFNSEFVPGTNPRQRPEVLPSQFQGGYISAGHPAPTAAGYQDNGIPAAPHHGVSAQQFTRDFLASGHSAPNTQGRQATFDSAVMGQAVNAMQRFHTHAKTLWPDLCQFSPTMRDYTQGDGATGISAATVPTFPTAPGESGLMSQNFRKALVKAEKTVAKQRAQITKMRAELDILGAQPDPARAAFRGIPAADGPVDRISLIDKAAGPEDGDRSEYIAYLQNLTQSGNPKLRMNASAALKGLITAP